MCVNIANGEVTLSFTDFALAGPPALNASRMYSSQTAECRALGFGWRSDLGCRLTIEGEVATVVGGDDDGLTIELSGQPPAAIAAPSQPRSTVKMDADGLELLVSKPNGARMLFARPVGARVSWNLTRAVGPNGDGVTYRYDSESRLEAITDFRRRECRLLYDHQGLITQIYLLVDGVSLGYPLVEFEYDRHRDLRAVHDARGAAQRYEYRDHLLVAYTNRTGGTTYYAYDERRRCVRTWNGNGRRARYFEFHPAKRTTVLMDSLGWRTVYRFNEANLVEERVDPLGNSKTSTYDAGNNLLFSQDEQASDGSVVLVDPVTNKVRNVDAAGSMYVDTYDQNGKLLQRADPLGQVTLWEYDARGNLAATETPLGARWSYEYDARGLRTSITDPLGHQAFARYSDNLSQVVYSDALGLVARLSFDAFGKLTQIEDPAGQQAQFTYDRAGNLTRLTGFDGDTVEVQYDPEGHPTEVADVLGRRYRSRYDAFGNLEEVTKPDDQRLRLSYDAEDRVVGVINEHGERTEFRHDPLGNVEQVSFFDGTTETYTRGASNTIGTRVRPDGRVVHHEYDPVGRLVAKRYPDGSETTFAYDGLGRLATADNGQCAVSFEFDADGRLTTDQQGDRRVEYRYDVTGRLSQITCESRSITYERDARGRPIRISDSANGAFDIEYDATGRAIAVTGSGGLKTGLTFDGEGRLRRQDVQLPRRRLIERNYEYDRRGRVTAVSDPRFVAGLRFEYDDLDQVVRVRADEQTVQHYGYDARGNVVTSHRFRDIRYGAGNRLLGHDDVAIETDLQGNVISRRSQNRVVSYAYGFEDELRSVRDARGGEVTFQYDPLLRRIAKSSDRGTTRFLWSGDSVLEEESTGEPRIAYLQLTPKGPLLAQAVGDTVYHCVSDQVGRPIELLTTEGTTVWRCLLPWSEPQMLGPASCALRFPGQYQDQETGLIYNRRRYLDPAIPRYLSADPVRFLQGFNFFSYVDNDFTNRIDPLGLADCFIAECDRLFKEMDNLINTEYDAETRTQTQPHPGALNVPHGGMAARAADVLRNIGQIPARRLPGDPLGQTMTGESHIGQYQIQQRRLQQRVDRWNELGCKPKNTSDPSRAGRVKQDADTYYSYEPPIKHRGDALLKFGK